MKVETLELGNKLQAEIKKVEAGLFNLNHFLKYLSMGDFDPDLNYLGNKISLPVSEVRDFIESMISRRTTDLNELQKQFDEL